MGRNFRGMDKKQATLKAARKAKLAAALKANLKRRKDQAKMAASEKGGSKD